MSLPQLDQLDLTSQTLYKGYYSLGLIAHCFPELALIPYRLDRHDHWSNIDINIKELDSSIKRALQTHKGVLIVPWEEDFMGQPDVEFTGMLNQYENQPVFLLSEMSAQSQLLYRFQHNLKVKILELPFVLVNDLICYWKVRPTLNLPLPPKSDQSYLCMIGRGQDHKFNLVQGLVQHQLQAYGLITRSNDQVPEFIRSNTVLNTQTPLYETHKLLTACRKEAAQVMINGVWVSSNVANYLHIEQTYDHPLIINVESTLGIFPATEKSIWPSMLGRIPLIYGPSGIMEWIQRFSSYDLTTMLDLKFDSIVGYDQSSYDLRLQALLSDNRTLICQAREVYADNMHTLASNRRDFVYNLYNFFCNQIQHIIKMV